MHLTAEHIEAAKRGETVRLAADDVEIVVLRADIYEQHAASRDNPIATYAAVLSVLDQEDEDPAQYWEYLDEAR